jgi:DNA polymerase III subunit gamma/tau
MATTQGSPGQSDDYVVVARRYRPQSFEQLVGQGQVSQALGNAIHTNRVGHAYLFTGARGVGKTSTARIFAKALNCVNGPTTTPCGECDICRGIASGEDVDVIEIDGASNRGIDEIRQLRSNVHVRPSRARFKIYIIDEVHMLTTPAFNALLKTLEEPPEHVKFIFCTTEADKIPITVLSRCQRFDFAPLETRSILDRLQLICENEGVEADPEALQILARRAAGSMRDSQSLLEQLLAFGGKRISVEDVHSMLGTAKSSRLSSLAQCIVERNAAEALRQLDAAVSEGVDLGQMTEQLLGYFRDTMAALVGCPADLLLHSSPADYQNLTETGRRLGLETILAIVQILDQTLIRLRQSTHVRTLVEIGLVRICRLEDLDQLSDVIAQLRDGSTAGTRPAGGSPVRPAPVGAAPSAMSGPAPRPQPTPAAAPTQRTTTPDVAGERPLQPAPTPPAASPAARTAPEQKKTPEVNGEVAPAPANGSEVAPLTERDALRIWQQALAELGDITADFASKFDSLAISGPNRLAIRFRKAYSTSVAHCDRPQIRSKLEDALARVAGRAVRLEFVTIPDPPAAATQPQRPVQTVQNRRRRMREAERNPLIGRAIELFDAEIIDVIEPVREAGEEQGAAVAEEA